jgi:cyclophilin family peptidyl-prolyl cis-trans isomerase
MSTCIRIDSVEPVSLRGRSVRRRHHRWTLQPLAERLEGRPLLSAALAPIAGVAAPAQLGYQVPLDGSGNADPSQMFTVTSDNPDIQVSVAQGPFWAVSVQHASSSPSDPAFSGTLTFQLFQDLTPATVAHVTQFTNDGYYNGKNISRVVPNFPGPSDYVVEGGALNPDGSGSSGQPGTPYGGEIVQQLAYTGRNQLAMARNSAPVSYDAEFFVTTGSPAMLDLAYTVFGQLVAGSGLLNQMTRVTTTANPLYAGEVSLPVSPVVITSATLTPTSVNGVIHVNTSSARAGESANITVTATDPTDGSHVTRSFKVTVAPYNGPTVSGSLPINFVPLADPVNAATNTNSAVSLRLAGHSGYPDPSTPSTLIYQLLSQPAHGTISQFDASTGSLLYTPDPGYNGPDSFQYTVQATGPQAMPAVTVSRPATVSITTAPPPLVTVTGVQEFLNKRKQLAMIVVRFSGPVNSFVAGYTQTYRLALPGSHGSYTARNAPVIQVTKAVYNAHDNTVSLQLRTPFVLGGKAQLQVSGLPPRGLTDGVGRLIDGDHNGTPGGNAIAYLTRSGVTLARKS